MIALDTNILLRFAVDDGLSEAAFAHDTLPNLATTAPAFYLSVPVLCESAWVLRGSFKYRRNEIAKFIEHLLADPLFSLESPDAAGRHSPLTVKLDATMPTA